MQSIDFKSKSVLFKTRQWKKNGKWLTTIVSGLWAATLLSSFPLRSCCIHNPLLACPRLLNQARNLQACLKAVPTEDCNATNLFTLLLAKKKKKKRKKNEPDWEQCDELQAAVHKDDRPAKTSPPVPKQVMLARQTTNGDRITGFTRQDMVEKCSFTKIIIIKIIKIL